MDIHNQIICAVYLLSPCRKLRQFVQVYDLPNIKDYSCVETFMTH